VFEVAVIRPGVYTPGGGPLRGERVAITEQFIRNVAPTLDGEPVNLGHSSSVRDEVGHHASPRVKEDDEGTVLRADLVLQESRPRFDDAISFIEGRLQAGQTPEYSMEVNSRQTVVRKAEPGETYQGEEFDVAFVDGALTGGAILSKGSCSPDDGCGIGMEEADKEHAFCPECGGACPDPDQSDHRITTQLSGTEREDTTTMSESDQESDSDGDQDLHELREQMEDVQTELADLQSRDEADHSERIQELEHQLEAYRERERERLTTQLKDAVGEDWQDEFSEEPSLNELRGAARAATHFQAAAAAGADSDPEPSRKTQGGRTTHTAFTTPSGHKVDLQAYNRVRSMFGLDPVNPDDGTANPTLNDAFRRAKRDPRGQARIVRGGVQE
jgi:uncharacterized Zn finger protein (UPF0148 family)